MTGLAKKQKLGTLSPLDKAIEAAGSVNNLAAAAGVKPQAISQWRKGVPPLRVLDVERVTGISRHELRPDIFGPAPRNNGDAP